MSVPGEPFRMNQERWAGAAHVRPCRLLRIEVLTLQASPISSSEGTIPKGMRKHFLTQRAPLSQMAMGGFPSPSLNAFFLSPERTVLS